MSKKFKVGDYIWLNCYTSHGASSEGYITVTNIKYKYDEDTGDPYEVICFEDLEFNAETGESLTKSDMFYIETEEPDVEPEITFEELVISRRNKTANILKGYYNEM